MRENKIFSNHISIVVYLQLSNNDVNMSVGVFKYKMSNPPSKWQNCLNLKGKREIPVSRHVQLAITLFLPLPGNLFHKSLVLCNNHNEIREKMRPTNFNKMGFNFSSDHDSFLHLTLSKITTKAAA